MIGCAADDPNKRAKTGAAIGAVAGAALGHQLDSRSGSYVGAAVGNYMDKQQQEFETVLAEEQRQNAIEVQRLQDETLKIDIANEVSFDFARAKIKPSFRPTLDKVGDILKRYPKPTISVCPSSVLWGWSIIWPASACRGIVCGSLGVASPNRAIPMRPKPDDSSTAALSSTLSRLWKVRNNAPTNHRRHRMTPSRGSNA